MLHNMWKMRGLAYMFALQSRSRKIVWVRDQVVERCMAYLNGWCIVFGWKVHGKKCMAFLYTIYQSASGKFQSKRKAFLVLRCGTWTLECLATQGVTHIVMPPKSIAAICSSPHMTSRAQSNGSQDRCDNVLGQHNAVLYKTVILLSINYLLAVDTGLPWTNSIPLQSAVVPTGLSEITPYSSPLLWYLQVSPTNNLPRLFCSISTSLIQSVLALVGQSRLSDYFAYQYMLL